MARATKAEWAKRVRAWRSSGLSGPAFSDRHGLNVRTLRYWAWRLEKESREEGPPTESQGPTFIELTGLTAGATPSLFEVVTTAGHTVRVPSDFDEESLGRLLDLLEARS